MQALKINEAYLRDRLEMLLRTPSPTGYTDVIVHQCARELERLDLQVEITRRGAIAPVCKVPTGNRPAPSSPISIRSVLR